VKRKSDGENVLVTVYVDDKDSKHFGSEIYSGQNYVVDSTKASYSRQYKQFEKFPKEYKEVLSDLVKQEKRVNWETVVGSEYKFNA
jgi:hypothetical protein